MAISLAARLGALTRPDLEVLLQRRPETRQLLDAKRPDRQALAEVIARPDAVRTAVGSLDAFLSNLLHVALWLSPDVSPAALAAQAPGVGSEVLLAGAQELSRWGLAFVVNAAAAGVNGSLGWSLEVPDCVVAAVTLPTGLGPRARAGLGLRTAASLDRTAAYLGLAHRSTRKDGLLDEIAAALSDPHTVRRLLAEAPNGAERIFRKIRDAGGAIAWGELCAAGYVTWSQQRWAGHREPASPLEWLESRGLVMSPVPVAYTGAPVALPAEVELALRGGRLFESWPSAAPPALAVAGTPGLGERAAAADQAASGDPSKILADMEVLLQFWAEVRPPSLQRGGLGVRELRKCAKALDFPERYAGFLYALAAEAGLVGCDGEQRVVPLPAATHWADEPPPLRWAVLFGAWVTCMLWTEPAKGLVDVDKVVRIPSLVRLRSMLVHELAALPADAATDAAALGRRLAWRLANLVHCEECTVELARLSLEALSWLGCVSGPPRVRLLEPARSAARDPGWARAAGPGTACFAASVSECLVGADLSIIVPGPPVSELGAALGRFADLKASSPARVYRLSEASLRRALDGGMKAAEITAVLERHAPRGIPQNVAYLIEDVATRHGHLRAGRAGLYLRSDDPALLAGAVADRRLRAFAPRLIAPNVALLDGDSPAKLLAALRSAGYLPVEDAGAGAGADPAAVHLRPLLTRSSFAPGMARTEAAALAGALTQVVPGKAPGRQQAPAGASPAGTAPAGASPAGASPAGTAPAGTAPAGAKPAPGPGLPGAGAYRNPIDIRQLMEVAAIEEMVVEISYLTSKGHTATLLIEPFDVDRAKVHAWCRQTDAEKTFSLTRIVWARATGERTTDDDDDDDEFDDGLPVEADLLRLR